MVPSGSMRIGPSRPRRAKGTVTSVAGDLGPIEEHPTRRIVRLEPVEVEPSGDGNRTRPAWPLASSSSGTAVGSFTPPAGGAPATPRHPAPAPPASRAPTPAGT